MYNFVASFVRYPDRFRITMGHERQTGHFTGVYFWDSEQSMRELQQTDLARTIPVAYKVKGPPRIEFFDVLFPLRG